MPVVMPVPRGTILLKDVEEKVKLKLMKIIWVRMQNLHAFLRPNMGMLKKYWTQGREAIIT